MKRIIYLLLFGLYSSVCLNAQNIVSNPSFEDYSICPNGSPTDIENVINWNRYRETPDYFNSCAPPLSVSVPANNYGYQQAVSGNAYAGFFSYGQQGSDTTFREYIGEQLSTILTIGQKYFVSFKINLTNKSNINCATNNLGTLFSTVSYSYSNPTPINNFAQIYTSNIITDTVNWTTISGSFIADSAYKYIIVGNFFDNPHTSYTKLNNSMPCAGYYFVDDICVSTDSMTCMGTIGINEQHQLLTQLSIFPNPTNSTFNITLPVQQTFNLQVADITGRTVYTNKNATGNITVDANGFSSGVYFVKAVNERTVLTGKLVKE